jgi:DeoR/GlpR family transcriptional regulator of sugar metabolism
VAQEIGIPAQDVFAEERRQQIASLVAEHGRARVVDLAARFGVSAVTIRKDLLVLESERRLVRAHGGAIAVERNRPEPAFAIRERLERDEKDRIGAFAAGLVADGEGIVLDASTTALYVARHLAARQDLRELTVLTNGMRIASELAAHPGMVVLMPGGRVRQEAMSLIGPLGGSMFRKVNLRYAFLGAAGFTIEAGLSDAIEEEAQIKRSMVAAAWEVVAIVDHTKWGRAASATFCRTDSIDLVLTDSQAPAAMVEALRRAGIRVELLGIDGDARATGATARTRSEESRVGGGQG